MSVSTVMVIILCLAWFLFLGCILMFPFIYLIGNLGLLEDKDPYENKCCGLNSTCWSHKYICTKCMGFVCHEERMTGICLGCGEGFAWTDGVVSTRLIIHNKRWSRQIKWRGDNFINKKKI